MKKYFSLLFVTLFSLVLCVSLAGCNDEIVIDPDAVKITVNDTDVSYEYAHSDKHMIYWDFPSSPTDFTGDRYDNTLIIDFGENPVVRVDVERSFAIYDNSLYDVRISYTETVSMQDGHFTISYGFELFDEVKAADCMNFHFTVIWSNQSNRVTQYGFSIHCIEE